MNPAVRSAKLEALEGAEPVSMRTCDRPHLSIVVPACQAWWRQSMGRTFNHIARAAIGFEMRDTQYGFKCFQRDAARTIFSRAQIDRYAFDVELLWIAQRLRLRVGELPVVWADDSHSKVHPIRDSLRMLVDLAAIRRHEASGAYAKSPAIGASDQRGPA